MRPGFLALEEQSLGNQEPQNPLSIASSVLAIFGCGDSGKDTVGESHLPLGHALVAFGLGQLSHELSGRQTVSAC